MKSKQQKWKIGYKDKSGPEIITDQNDDFVCTLWSLGSEYYDEENDLTDKMASDRALIAKAPELKQMLQEIINEWEHNPWDEPRYITSLTIRKAKKLLKHRIFK